MYQNHAHEDFQNIQESLIPIFFPVHFAQISHTKFQYPNNIWKELCSILVNQVTKSDITKENLDSINIVALHQSVKCDF